MSRFHQFVATTLLDKRIDDTEVRLIREHLYQDGRLDIEDVKLLVELYCEATEYCSAFEELFFAVLERVMLADGEIQPSEQFYLLRMLYSDRQIRDRERDFLRKLRATATRTTPEFEALCDEALHAPATAWSVGGR